MAFINAYNKVIGIRVIPVKGQLRICHQWIYDSDAKNWEIRYASIICVIIYVDICRQQVSCWGEKCEINVQLIAYSRIKMLLVKH